MTSGPSADALLDALTLGEQVSLLAGSDFWHTVAIERVGLPRLRVTDGPNGARGTRFDGAASIDVPCSTLLAAAWDPALVEQVGELLGRETLAKGARVLLAPTVNLHRTPIGGRNFECMSEDPHLTARTAVAYVKGLQSTGVAACIKHFVGNDTEFERLTINAVIDERTMRELYLVPFEAAVKEAGVLAVMTSYNRINGPFASDSATMVTGVLRGEWGFDGLVMSDWYGTHSTVEALAAGVDLEMPGPAIHRGAKLQAAVDRGEADPAHVRRSAGNVLRLMERVGGLQAEPGPELTRDDPDDLALVRRAAASGMVLLKNGRPGARAPLPIAAGTTARIAVIGPNAAAGQVMGGGSAHVTPTSISHPLDAIVAAFTSATVEHSPGASINKRLPELDQRRCSGIELAYFADPADLDRTGASPAATSTTGTSRLMWFTHPLRKAMHEPFGARLRTTFTPDVTGDWTLGITSVADARLLVDGEVVADNAGLPIGDSFFGNGRNELTATVALDAGRAYELVAEVRRPQSPDQLGGLYVGAEAPRSASMVDDAVDLAARSDLAIVVVGTNDDWESEGWDRTTLSLPGTQDELVRRVAEASPATVVVVNAGSPVAMPWLDQVDAVVLVWFPGQEMGNALVDVLTGTVEPQGRLPVTFPARLEDTPAFEHHPGRNGTAHYLERRLIGYRWYDTVGREPLFPFGYGLGYADTAITAASVVDELTVDVTVTNASDRQGVEVVQVYAHRVDRSDAASDEPDQRLVGFAKVAVAPNGSASVRIALDARAYATWDADAHAWVDVPGRHELRIGTSSRHHAARLVVRG